MDVLLLEVGSLFEKSGEEDAEFDFYSAAYDHQFGYFDEAQDYALAEKKANIVRFARNFVEKGKDGSYAIISVTWIDDDCVEDDGGLFLLNDVENEQYPAETVVFSLCKKDGEYHENFVIGQKIA